MSRREIPDISERLQFIRYRAVSAWVPGDRTPRGARHPIPRRPATGGERHWLALANTIAFEHVPTVRIDDLPLNNGCLWRRVARRWREVRRRRSRALAVPWDEKANINRLMLFMDDAEVFRNAPCLVYCEDLRNAEAKVRLAGCSKRPICGTWTFLSNLGKTGFFSNLLDGVHVGTRGPV